MLLHIYYNQLLGWWFANQNQNTKQKHPSLNGQSHRNWIRQRFVSATGYTRGRCALCKEKHFTINLKLNKNDRMAD
jgi:hypothetical protein